jgi:hypothetical protein
MKQLSILLCCLIAFAVLTSGTFAQNCNIRVDPKQGNVTCYTNGSACQTIKQAISVGFNQANSCSEIAISLASGTYTGSENVGLSFSNQAGSISYNPNSQVKMLNISGPADAILDGGSNSQIFSFADVNFEVQIRGINFANGASQNGGCLSYTQQDDKYNFYLVFSLFTDCDASGNGGGVFIQSASYFHLIGNEFERNRAQGNGGGLYIDSQTVYYTNVEDGFFTNNSVVGSGGGAYVTSTKSPSGKIMLVNLVFLSNSASHGGGLFTDIASARLIEFSQNSAKTAGGNLAISASTVDFTRSISISQFSALKGTAPLGGGVYILNANVLLDKATINANTASSTGGGVYVATDDPKYQANKVEITNSFIQVNTAQQGGGGIFCKGAVSPWTNVFFQSNIVNLDSDNQDVSCDDFCVSEYCTTCPCKESANHCKDCPSQTCSFTDDNECACYVSPLQAEESCSFPQASPSASPNDPGLSHGAKVWLGLTFGLFLPLILVAIVGFVYLRNRRNRYSGYSTLGENERLVSNW